jgi:phosphatidylglycerol lysyltransferase
VKIKPAHLIGPLIAIGLFSLALRVLYRELGSLHYEDVLTEFSNLPIRHLVLAGLFTALSYLVLTLYDVLAMRYVNYPLPYYRVAMASFIGYTLSHNLGFPLLTGGAARYRLFSSWGLSAAHIAQAIAFSGLVFWVGFVLLSSIVLLIDPPLLPPGYSLFFTSLRPVGVICLLLVLLYFGLFGFRNRALRIKDFEFPAPPIKLSLEGVVVSAVDWMLAANVAYVLLPQTSLNYVEFLGLFLLGQVAGLLSHVPGGLGVFEATVLMFMSGQATVSQLAGSLLAYRFIYYMLPLLLSSGLLLAHESLTHGKNLVQFFSYWLKRVSAFLPQFVAFCMFCSGAMLLFSGATPPASGRLSWLADVVPLHVIETSHFVGSLVGVGLILLARSVQHKLTLAYPVSVVLLLVGIVASLLKGLDYEEALILSLMLVFVIASREHFYRKASLFAQAFEPEWITAMILVFVATIWLIFFAYKHVEYANELWWEFSWAANAPRSLRATVGALALTLIWAVTRLLTPARPDFVPASQDDLNLAWSAMRNFPRTYACLALLGDKSFWFNEQKSAFVMFGVEGRSCIALGDPVGSKDDSPELVWQFREYCDRHGSDCVFYQVHHETLPFYVDTGLTLLKLGQEALVPLGNFSIDGKAKSAFRSTRNRFTRENCAFEILPSSQVPALMPELQRISDDWLKHKNTREKGFSLGFFYPGYLARFPIALVRQNGRIIGFANIWATDNKRELSVDLMRYTGSAPSGIMDFLFVELMLWGRSQGYEFFNLGMAPLSGLESHNLAPMWNKVGNLLFRHGEHFYNFQGILHYKNKFDPVWEPRYLASPGGLALPRIFTNLAALISRGLKGVFAK